MEDNTQEALNVYISDYRELRQKLQPLDIIMDALKYYKIVSIKEDTESVFGEPNILLTLNEVAFHHTTWSWEPIGDVFSKQYNILTSVAISKTKEVDYVLLGDVLYDKEGNHIHTVLDTDPEGFDDSERKVRYMLDDRLPYTDFRVGRHIVEQHNTVEGHNAEVAKLAAQAQHTRTLQEERMRKIRLL
jgi:hypothetical protein